MLETVEIETGANPTASIVWLHGLGADGNDFVPIVDEMELPKGFDIRFVFPHAPMIPVSINSGYVMRAWYDITMDGLERRPDGDGIRRSQAQVEELLAREKSRGVPASRIVLAGFSQGGAVTLQAGLRHAERLAGLLVLSSYLPLPETLPGERSAANADVPIFMAHGTYDMVVPLALSERSRDTLLAQDYALEWKGYPMQHSVCAQELIDIGRWLKRVLPAPAP